MTHSEDKSVEVTHSETVTDDNGDTFELEVSVTASAFTTKGAARLARSGLDSMVGSIHNGDHEQ